MTLPKPKKTINEKAVEDLRKRIRDAFKKGLTPRDIGRMIAPELVEEIFITAFSGEGIAKTDSLRAWERISEIDKIKGAKIPLKITPITLEEAKAIEQRKAEDRQRKFMAAQG